MSEVCKECGRQVGRVNWLDGECVMCFSGWYPPEKLNQETMTNKTDKLIESREMAWKFDFKNGVKAGLKYTPLVCRGLIQKIIRDFELIAQSARDEERERIAADFKFHSAFNPSCSCAFIVESLTRND